jgi:hypothetical protein
MPVHIKLMVSALTLLAGGGFFYFESTLGDSQLAYIGAGLSIFMVIAMWVFPEAGGKKKS